VLVRRDRTYFAAGGKGKVIFYTHHHTQVANRGQFGKNHFEFGKKQRFSFDEFRECRGKIKDFHLLNFESAYFWGRGKIKDFHLLNFESAYFWVKEDENLYKISL